MEMTTNRDFGSRRNFLKDGTSKTISANNTTVWWNNKIHVIKDKEMFINLTEGIFFLEDLQTK